MAKMIKYVFANKFNTLGFVLQFYFYEVMHLHVFHQIKSSVV